MALIHALQTFDTVMSESHALIKTVHGQVTYLTFRRIWFMGSIFMHRDYHKGFLITVSCHTIGDILFED